MAKELSVLQQQAETIKTEVNKGANTSSRIGGMFSDILDYNEEKRTELDCIKLPRIKIFNKIKENLELSSYIINNFLIDLQVENAKNIPNAKIFLSNILVNSQGYTSVNFEIYNSESIKESGIIAVTQNGGSGIELIQQENDYLKVKVLVNWDILSKESKTYSFGGELELTEQAKKEHKGFIDLYINDNSIDNNIYSRSLRKKPYNAQIFDFDAEKLKSKIQSDVLDMFLDIEIEDATSTKDTNEYYVSNIYQNVEGIIKGVNVTAYNEDSQIGIWFFQVDDSLKDVVIYAEKNIGSNLKMKAIINFSAFTSISTTKNYNLGKLLKINKECCKPHIGDINFYSRINHIQSNYTKYTPNVNIFKRNPLSNDNYYEASLGIMDIQIEDVTDSKDITKVYLQYILKNASVEQQTYNSVNLLLRKSGGSTVGNIINSKTQGKGIEFIDFLDNNVHAKILINWDAISDGNKNYGVNLELDSSVLQEHKGLIDLYQKAEFDKEKEFLSNDQMYILNNKVVCNNDHRNSVNTIAKYAKVDMGSNVKKMMCRFTTKGGQLAIITTKLNTNAGVADITNNSVHLVYSLGAVEYGLFIGNNWKKQSISYSSTLVSDDETEYEVGMEFLGENQLKIYLPDGTNQTVTIDGLDASNGRYAIWEHYIYYNVSSLTNNFPRPSFTGFFCQSEEGLQLRDNFKRNNGNLSIAPTGQIYRLFRNSRDTDTIYDAN